MSATVTKRFCAPRVSLQPGPLPLAAPWRGLSLGLASNCARRTDAARAERAGLGTATSAPPPTMKACPSDKPKQEHLQTQGRLRPAVP